MQGYHRAGNGSILVVGCVGIVVPLHELNIHPTEHGTPCEHTHRASKQGQRMLL